MTARRLVLVVLRIILLTVLVIWAGFPIYWMFSTAATNPDTLYMQPQPIIPELWRLSSIFTVLSGDSMLARWMTNSFMIASGTTVLSLLLAITTAYALSRYKFVGRGVLGFLLFATQMLPEMLVIVPLYSFYITLRLLNQQIGVILAISAFAFPVAVWILKSAMDKVPFEIEEAARVDGCPSLAILTTVVLPLIAPSVAAAAVVMFFDGWNEYLFASTFLRDRDHWAATTGLAAYVGEFITPLGTVFAAAIVFAFPAVVFSLFAQRRMVSGLTSGGVKG
jgi:multiple sugar transport system permease protein